MNGLWSLFTSCWFEVDLIADLFVSVATPLPADIFLSKISYTVEANPLWYPSHFEFYAILKDFSLNTLSDSVLLA